MPLMPTITVSGKIAKLRVERAQNGAWTYLVARIDEKDCRLPVETAKPNAYAMVGAAILKEAYFSKMTVTIVGKEYPAFVQVQSVEA